MKVDFSHEFITSKDTPLLDENREPVTLKTISVEALFANYPDETAGNGNPGISGEEKYKRSQLATKIKSDPKGEFEPEEIVLIKKLIGKGFGTLIVGQAYPLLNGIEKTKAETNGVAQQS